MKISPEQVSLRPTAPSDIPALFAIQMDPLGNELAGTHPRDRIAFEARWSEIFCEQETPPCSVIPRVILVDGVLVGSINVFPLDGQRAIGYWLDRAHWHRGIATRAVELLLQEVAARPLYARVTAGNVHSRRVLERNGFVCIEHVHVAGDDRFVSGERLVFRID